MDTITRTDPNTDTVYTFDVTDAGNPILNWPLRYEMTAALTEAITTGARGDHAGYLSTLQHTAPGTEITPDHDLADVLTWFQIFEY